MKYGPNEYAKDLYILEHGNAIDSVDAKIRVRYYEHFSHDEYGYIDLDACKKYDRNGKKHYDNTYRKKFKYIFWGCVVFTLLLLDSPFCIIALIATIIIGIFAFD